MDRLRLIPEDESMLESLETSERFLAQYGAEIYEEDVPYLQSLVQDSLKFYRKKGAWSPWGGYLAVAEAGFQVDVPCVVGCGGFKGNPDHQLIVEIAYHTLPRFESRGIATEIARQLVQISTDSPMAHQIIAHTLPERNASCRILEKVGFSKFGPVTVAEDGDVWRWTRAAR